MPAFYVDSLGGSDARNGQSPSSAWKTLSRASRRAFKPGDRLLLRRSCVWPETLRIKGRSDPGSPILLSSYGDGPLPRIVVREGHGISGAGPVSGWRISGLEISGEKLFNPDGMTPGKNCGICLSQREPCLGLTIEDCHIHDVDGHAILLSAQKSRGPVFSGFSILNCEIHGASTGISTGGPWPAGPDATQYCEKFRIAHCLVHDIGTDGIVLSHCRDGVIERCTAYRTGLGRTRRSPVGIWYFLALRCVIQFCESYDNRTAGNTADGGGFDLDGGCIECVMQYNYSHDNAGAGYLICSYDPKGAPCEKCVTRFNISINDGLANDYPAIMFWQASNCATFNNTCVTRRSSPLKFISDTEGHLIANNVFLVDSPTDIPVVKSVFPLGKNEFRNNLYWRTQGPPRFEVESENNLDFASFSRLVPSQNELSLDPGLSALTGRHLHPVSGSPLLKAGCAVPGMGESDFYGVRPTPGEIPNVGCSLRSPAG